MLLAKKRLLPLLLLAASFVPGAVFGQTPIRAIPEGSKLEDRRLKPLKDLNGYFPFKPPENAREWNRNSVRFRFRSQNRFHCLHLRSENHFYSISSWMYCLPLLRRLQFRVVILFYVIGLFLA